MKSIKTLLIALGLVAGLAFVGAPAAMAAPYPGTVATSCKASPRPGHYVKAGRNAYAAVSVTTFGTGRPAGRIVVVWHGNTGKNYRAQKYTYGATQFLGPVKLKRGTYKATVYFFPPASSVYKKCTTTFKQVARR